ncbi:DoxX family protein [Microvirga sp. ACRRW]|uniref:DoxX family protein n=1 Tax=Microvirga sp. ACRRW TaxID=2918205 RepID=UPI001EF6E8BB|nr:DoxX family protein [Microvirga sp. ACRRW]MCG7392666.1 DoxX family protein [Microvirga sp. ACRRW]
MNTGATNGILLLSRLLLAGCFLPPAIARLTNISGFAASLTLKGIPYGDIVATAIVVVEIVAPLALILGLAPRISASVLIAGLVITTGALHRFWDYGGLTRQMEQTVFLANLGVLSGLLFYWLVGPGAWSWKGWLGGLGPRKPAKKKRQSRPRATKPKPAPVRPFEDEDDEYANAA